MKNKNILLRALLTGMLCITSLTIFTGGIDKKDGDGMVNGRTADGELPENGDAEPVPIKANKAGKPEIKDSSTTEEPEQPEEPETAPKPEKKEETEEQKAEKSLEALNKEKTPLQALVDQIVPFNNLGYDVHKLLAFKSVKYRFGRIPVDYVEKLMQYTYDNVNTHFYESKKDQD